MIEIYQSKKNGSYYFRVVAKNGEIMLRSSGFASKAGLKNCIKSCEKVFESKPEIIEVSI